MKFSKGKLKKFVCWLFFYFPDLSPEIVKTVDFWSKIVLKLTNLTQNGDSSGDQFFHLFVIIWGAIKEQNAKNNQGKVDNQLAQSSPVLPKSSLPSTLCPNTMSPTLGELEGANHKAQKVDCLPGSPQLPQYPCPE